jgi:hypothetical protein
MPVISPPGIDRIGAGAPENEIEVTPEMMAAGAHFVLWFDRERGPDAEETAALIYRAMASAAKIFEMPRRKSNSLNIDSE